MLNRRKKFSRGLTRNFLQRDAARFRQHLGDLDHIGRLVALAAEFAGRQIRRVGLDHDAIGRQFGREIAQGLRFLEGQNARERDRKTQRNRFHRQFAPAGVAMQHGAKRSLGHFVFEDAAAVFIGFAGMDDQRQAGRAGGGDMGAKAALLRFARAVLVEIIQPRFAQRHDLGMLRQFDQLVGRNAVFFVGLMRMGADRAIDVRETARRSRAARQAASPASRS